MAFFWEVVIIGKRSYGYLYNRRADIKLKYVLYKLHGKIFVTWSRTHASIRIVFVQMLYYQFITSRENIIELVIYVKLKDRKRSLSGKNDDNALWH